MGSWSFENIGASAFNSNVKYVEKIFNYMGYRPDPKRTPDGDECMFIEPMCITAGAMDLKVLNHVHACLIVMVSET